MKVKELFNLSNEFGEFQVIYGNDYLDNIVKNINIMDVPWEGAHFKKGDFVIAALDIIIKEKINLVDIINMLSQEKISMLGFISNGAIDDEIINHCQQMIKLATNVNFPIVLIPLNVKYRSIVSTIEDTKNVDSFLIEQLKNNLVILKNTPYFSTSNILKIVSDYIDGTTLLLSQNGEILNLIQSNPIYEERDIPVDRIFSLIKGNQANPISTLNPIVYKEENEIFTIYSLDTYGKVLGYLCTVVEADTVEKREYRIKVINEAIPFVIIALMSYHEKELIYNKSKDEFMRDLLYGIYSDKNTIQKEARFFNIEYRLKRFVWIINVRNLKSDHPDSLTSDKIPQNIINDTLNTARSYYYDDYSIVDNSSVIFVKVKSDISNEKILEKYNNLLNTLEFQMPEYKFSIGVSRAYETLDNLNLAYEDAVFSLKIGSKIFKNGKRIYAYDDLIVYHLLYKYPSNPILERLYNNGIGKILSHDNENNTTLFETVQVLVKCNFVYSEAADKLYIHRNTLYQRIKRIEEVTGFDMNSSETRLVLQLGLKIHDIFSLA